MLAIRMQRTGRTGHAQFRVIAQDSRFSPTSGRVVEYLGNYDPHTKASSLERDKIEKYISNGAQPSDRVIKLLQKEGVKLPSWVKTPASKSKSTRNPEKLQKAEQPAPVATETPGATDAATTAKDTVDEAPAETVETTAPEAEKVEPIKEEAQANDLKPEVVQEPAPESETTAVDAEVAPTTEPEIPNKAVTPADVEPKPAVEKTDQ